MEIFLKKNPVTKRLGFYVHSFQALFTILLHLLLQCQLIYMYGVIRLTKLQNARECIYISLSSKLTLMHCLHVFLFYPQRVTVAASANPFLFRVFDIRMQTNTYLRKLSIHNIIIHYIRQHACNVYPLSVLPND